MIVDIEIDDDAYNFAFAYAKAKGMDFDAAVNELLKQREHMPPAEETSQE